MGTICPKCRLEFIGELEDGTCPECHGAVLRKSPNDYGTYRLYEQNVSLMKGRVFSDKHWAKFSEQKDRPDREKIAEGIYCSTEPTGYLKWRYVRKDRKDFYRGVADQILALTPDIEQIDAMLVEARRTAKSEEREDVKSIALKAIKDEPEFPSDMPDVIWETIHNDRHNADIVFRNVVKITKREITGRFLQALSKEE